MGLRVFIQGPGLERVKVIEVGDEADIADVIKLAQEAGVRVDESDAVVLVEDTDTRLDMSIRLADAGVGDRASLHVGRCRRVDVSVRYGKETKNEDFSVSQRLRHVMKWAVGNRGFDISNGDAQDLVLVVPGQQHPVDLDDHVGLFVVGQACEVRLDLVPSERIQG
jgi:hypothetical protein